MNAPPTPGSRAPASRPARRRNPATMHAPTGYTHVVEVTAGRPVYISGQLALDSDGKLVGPGDLRAQARQVFENLRLALADVGATFDDVVKLNYYLVDISQIATVREVRADYLDDDRLPASTAIQVARLLREDLLIEIEAVAVIPPPATKT